MLAFFSNFRFGLDTGPSKIKKRTFFPNPGFEKAKSGLFPIFRVGTDTGPSKIKNKKPFEIQVLKEQNAGLFFKFSFWPRHGALGRTAATRWAWTGEG